MIAFRLADRSLGLISMLVLARLLVPQDFGVVAMAMSVVGLLELLTAFGFDIALIHKKENDRDEWDTAWTFGVVFGLGTAAVLGAAATPMASFYRTPDLADVIRALALGAVIQGFRNIGVVAFRKEMQFDREFRFMVARKIAGFVVTIPAAFILENYWALVIGQLVGRIVETGLSYRVHPYRPRLTLVAAGNLLHFSKWLLAANLSGYLRERGADWVLGRTAGAHALGSYNLGAEVAAMPSTELLAPVNRALIPVYAKIVNSQGNLAGEYISVLSMMALIGIPAVVGLAGVSSLLVPVILGPNWSDVIPILTVLAFGGLAHIVAGNVYPAYLALGRPDLTLKMNILAVSLFFVGMLVAVPRFGPIGAAWSALVANFTTVPVSIFFVVRLMKVRPSNVVLAIWRPILAACAMHFLVRSYSSRVEEQMSSGNDLLLLMGGVLVGAVAYTLGVSVLWLLCGRPEGGEATLLRKLRQCLGRMRGST